MPTGNNKLRSICIIILLAYLILSGCSSQIYLTAAPEIDQNISTEPATPTRTQTPAPTRTRTFVTVTPPLVRDLPARIAYITLGNPDIIGILDQDNKQTVLAKDCIFCDSLAWSPDGTLLAFKASFKHGEISQIYIVNVGDGQIRQITSDSHPKFDLSWSPDGESLIYVEEGDPTSLVIRKSSGTFVKKITIARGYETNPTWSLDGSMIAFLYREERFLEYSELWVMDRDGENRRQVAYFPVSLNTISWSPNGEEILFSSYNDCGKLYSVHIDGSNLRQIVDYPGCIENPSWSPDGEWIMFIGSESKTSSLSSPSWTIYLVSADGSGLSRLPVDIPGRPIISIWDPSGK